MKHIFPVIGILAASLGVPGCSSTGTTAPTTAAPATNARPFEGAATAGTASPTPSASTPVSSFKETARADRENAGSIVPYPFTTCAVIRKDLEGSPNYRRVYKNHEVLFCCLPCLHTFDSNPEPFMPRIIEAAAAKARGETVNSGW